MQSTIKKTSKTTAIVFLIAIIAITIFIAVTTFLMIGKPLVIDQFDEIDTVQISDYNKQEESEYYVFVYNSESYKEELLEDIVIEYAEYARSKSSDKKIYILDYATNKDIIGKEHMDITNSDASIARNIPALLLIKDGKISETKTTISTIKTVLYDEMN